MTTATSLTWLGRLIANPSPDDWKTLFDRYGPLLHESLARIGIPDFAHDELIQKVLVVVVARVQTSFEYRGPGSFRRWLRGILANCVKEWHRQKANQDHRIAPDVNLDALADPHSDLSRCWDREDAAAIVNRLLTRVQHDFEPDTWTVFLRLVLDEEDATAVAADMGLERKTVIRYKNRVLTRLRAEPSLSWLDE